MSLFLNLALVADAAVDAVMGESLLITPWLPGEFVSGVADPDNAAFTAVGVLDVQGVVVDGAGTRSGARSEVETVKPVAEFALSQFGDGRPLPQKGTQITATTRPGSPVYEVVSAEPDGLGRIVFQLAQKS